MARKWNTAIFGFVGSPETGRARRELVVVLLLGAAAAALNFLKPIHIDDALYVALAKWTRSHPLDPFGLRINWQGEDEPAYRIALSPPLINYWLAGATILMGDSENSLHAAMAPFALLLAWATARLARQFDATPTTAAALVVLGPVCLVGMNVMLDVPLAALTTAALSFLIQARRNESNSVRWARWSGWFAAGAVAVKYAGVALLPLTVLAALGRRRFRLLVALVAPVLALLLWQWWSASLYGSSQVDSSMGFLKRFQSGWARQLVERTATMGAQIAITLPLWLATLATGRPLRLAALVLGVGIPLALKAPANFVFWTASLFGLVMIAYLLLESASRGADGWLLAAWIAGAAAFVILFGPFVAPRSFLPIYPALIVLFLSRRPASAWRRRTAQLAGAATVSLGLALFWADLHWARTYPASVAAVSEKYAGRPAYFLGHWGWQHYCEARGWRAVDLRQRSIPAGTLLLAPLRADAPTFAPPAGFRLLEDVEHPPHPLRLTTWNREQRIRFYGGDFGEIPWGFSSAPAERISVFEYQP